MKTHRAALKMSIFFSFLYLAFNVSAVYSIPCPFKNLPKQLAHQLTHNKLTDTIRKRNLQSFKPPQQIRSAISPAHLFNAISAANRRAFIVDAVSSTGQPVVIEAGHKVNKLPSFTINKTKLFESSGNHHRKLF